MPDQTIAVLVQTQVEVADEADYTIKAQNLSTVVETVLSDHTDFVSECLRRECIFEIDMNEDSRALFVRMAMQLEPIDGTKMVFDKKKLKDALAALGVLKVAVTKKQYKAPPPKSV